MSLKELAQKELQALKTWTEEANMQAHLAASEASSELRKIWMETEQNIAKLEAKLADVEGEAEQELQELVGKLKGSWDKLKRSKD